MSIVSHLVQTFLHIAGQQFALRASLCYSLTVSIGPRPSHECKALHILSACTHIRYYAFAKRHPLDTSRLSPWSDHFHIQNLVSFTDWNAYEVHAALLLPDRFKCVSAH